MIPPRKGCARSTDQNEYRNGRKRARDELVINAADGSLPARGKHSWGMKSFSVIEVDRHLPSCVNDSHPARASGGLPCRSLAPEPAEELALHDCSGTGQQREALMRFLGSMGVVVSAVSALGCGGVTVREVSPASPHSMSAITVERIQGCANEFGKELESGSYNIHPIVKVDTDGYKRGVEMTGIPDTAPNLAICMRLAVQDMAIPASVFNLRSTHAAASTNASTVEQRSMLGNPAIVVVVVVGLGEIVLEAGAYTVLFAVTVKVVEKAADDVAELAKRGKWFEGCKAHYAACIATTLGGPLAGNHYKSTLCDTCFRRCDFDKAWPSAVGNGSCEYWTPDW